MDWILIELRGICVDYHPGNRAHHWRIELEIYDELREVVKIDWRGWRVTSFQFLVSDCCCAQLVTLNLLYHNTRPSISSEFLVETRSKKTVGRLGVTRHPYDSILTNFLNSTYTFGGNRCQTIYCFCLQCFSLVSHQVILVFLQAPDVHFSLHLVTMNHLRPQSNHLFSHRDLRDFQSNYPKFQSSYPKRLRLIANCLRHLRLTVKGLYPLILLVFDYPRFDFQKVIAFRRYSRNSNRNLSRYCHPFLKFWSKFLKYFFCFLHHYSE